jgi:hypothetical protein
LVAKVAVVEHWSARVRWLAVAVAARRSAELAAERLARQLLLAFALAAPTLYQTKESCRMRCISRAAVKVRDIPTKGCFGSEVRWLVRHLQRERQLRPWEPPSWFGQNENRKIYTSKSIILDIKNNIQDYGLADKPFFMENNVADF